MTTSRNTPTHPQAGTRTAPHRVMENDGLSRRMSPCAVALAVFFALAATGRAKDIHVSPDGSDSAAGTRDAPLASLAAARDAARPFAGREKVTIHVHDGVYHLPEVLVLGPEDSGAAGAPVVYQAVNEGGAVLSGGLRLKPSWQPHRNGILKTPVPAGLVIDQLFADGKRQHMARYPDYDPAKTTAAYQGFAADAISSARAARWADPIGGYIHAMHRFRWGGYHYRITGKQADGTPAYEGGWQNNRQMGMHPEYRMVENIFEELDAPGEWYHDAKAGILYLIPPAGMDPAKAAIDVVRLPGLVEWRGSLAKPVRFITFKGFVFRHTARTFMETREPLLRSDWTIHRGAAALLTGVEDVGIVDCKFDQPGGNAVLVSQYARRVLMRGCHIIDPGASGVVFVGDPAAVRNPLFEYSQTHDLATIDRTPGPKTANHPADCAVEDCLIHGVGRIERQTAAVQISMSARITVRDTTIHDCSRAGINVSEGTWGGHLIERCDVFDTVLETHDHGSFNSWGRDRYWLANRRVLDAALAREPELALLDAVETTVIRHNRWRCDHGWDVDLDDGSSNYDIHHNLMLAGGLKLREGFRRKAWNNIMVNNGLHPHVWFADSGDHFTSNIVMSAHRGVRTPDKQVRGAEIDRNLFFTVDSAKVASNHDFGWDRNSISADPLFMDPAKGDFRVRDGSPAFGIGFENFPMDRFGVKKPSLRAIARTPVIPALRTDAGPAEKDATGKWFGATVRALSGEEFSAFGVSREDGGIQIVRIPPRSKAAVAGFKADDVIQRINGRKTASLEDLVAASRGPAGKKLAVGYVRMQQAATLDMKR